VGIQNLK